MQRAARRAVEVGAVLRDVVSGALARRGCAPGVVRRVRHAREAPALRRARDATSSVARSSTRWCASARSSSGGRWCCSARWTSARSCSRWRRRARARRCSRSREDREAVTLADAFCLEARQRIRDALPRAVRPDGSRALQGRDAGAARRARVAGAGNRGAHQCRPDRSRRPSRCLPHQRALLTSRSACRCQKKGSFPKRSVEKR